MEAWRVTEAMLAQMHLEVQDRGRSFLIVTLSNGIQVTPHPEQTRNYMEALGITDIFAPDHRIEDFGKRHSFDVLTLAPALQAMARDRKVNMHGFGNYLGLGHWNQNGHRAAAALIAEYLCHSSGHAATAPTKTSEPPNDRTARTSEPNER
jgi:hypothetical protein